MELVEHPEFQTFFKHLNVVIVRFDFLAELHSVDLLSGSHFFHAGSASIVKFKCTVI